MASSSRLGVQLLSIPFARLTTQRIATYATKAGIESSIKDKATSIVESGIPPKKTRTRKLLNLVKTENKVLTETPKMTRSRSKTSETKAKEEDSEIQPPKKARSRKKAVSTEAGQLTDAPLEIKSGEKSNVEENEVKPKKKRLPSRQTQSGITAKKKTSFTLDSNGPFPHLPKKSKWDEAFASKFHYDTAFRFVVANENTIETIVKAMNLKSRSKAAGQKLTIIESYPGPGMLTRRLLQDVNVEKVIAMEDHKSFLPWLEKLKKDSSLGDDASKLHIFEKSSYVWESFTEIMDEGLLDHIPAIKEIRQAQTPASVQFGKDWKATSPVIMVSQLPTTVKGEQLLAQYTAAISNRQWQFRYSRMPMFFVCSEHLGMRCVAQPGDRSRSRMSLLAQALTNPKILLDSTKLTPHEEHFWPSKISVGPILPRTKSPLEGGKLASGLSKQDNCFFLIEPREEPLVFGIEMEAFEFIIRSIFVFKGSSIKIALSHLAPGAVNLLNVVNSGHPAMAAIGDVKIDPETRVANLSLAQFVGLAKLFERWPFRPTHLFEESRNVSRIGGTLLVN